MSANGDKPSNSYQCEYLTRRKTFCKSMKTVGRKYCSKHWKPAVIEIKAESIDNTAKKSNLKRHLKRMLNPFIIRSQDINLTFTRKIHLDIGSAKGKYLKTLSEEDKDYDFVGVEIFNALVIQANREFGSDNLVYVNCNINRDLEKFPMLSRVTLLFPDPWSCGPNSTDKNAKRRVMNKDFAVRLATKMHPGSEIYFCSDWLELALDIKGHLMATGKFNIPEGEGGGRIDHIAKPPYVPTISSRELETRADVPINTIDVENNYLKPSASDLQLNSANDLWLDGIPYDGLQTERDQVCETQWRQVYRLILVRDNDI